MTIYKNYYKDYMEKENYQCGIKKMCLGVKGLNKIKNI